MSKWLLSLIIITFSISIATGTDKDDPVARAMSDELKRSMDELIIEGMPPPYFIGYLINEDSTISIESHYGSITRSESTRQRELSIDLRVGDAHLDNTNFYASWQDVWNYRKELIEEDSYDALRHHIWYYTDKAYKKALEVLAGKKAYLQANPTKDDIPDFASVEPFIEFSELPQLAVNISFWEKQVQAASDVFKDYPVIQNWHVSYTGKIRTYWYVNSEGSQHRVGKIYHILDVSATIQAEDGERLTGFRQYLTSGDEKPLSGEALLQDIGELAADLEAMAKAASIDEYVGPILFTEQAAAQFISHLFVEQLSLPRKPLVANSWMSQYMPTGKLAGRVNRRVFPDFVNITDEPQRVKWEGKQLAGYQTIDNEGVPSQNITLVENGRLLTLPMKRQPTKKISNSNGHGKVLPNQMTIPGITNLIVSSSKPVKDKKMITKLRRLCKDYDSEYGLLIKQFDESVYSNRYRTIEETDESEILLPRPTIVYKVFADDGRIEPVRGLMFDEVSIRNLRDIVAMGKDTKAYNLTQPTIFSQFRYAASIITPSILVEEMELKQGMFQEPMPITANPMFIK
ncbi:MAG: metallopeptidase TldD-related protein [Candidatus Hatepunaea meridiana]|nr:metallopeptidase TldD-related protein [Candidatus Hatepunaea meridiana]